MTDISGTTHNSLAERLDLMENNTKDIADEVEEARSTYTDLDARFDADETAIENLETNKIPYSDIVTDLITNNDNKPLAASQGRELK
jgi:septation ring formation regulator EzrA